MDAEQARLERLYTEMGDGEIARLAGEPGELTDAARAAIGAEMTRRGLAARAPIGRVPGGVGIGSGGSASSPEVAEALDRGERESGFAAGIPGVFPASAATVEQALEPGGEDAHGFVSLMTLFDGHELAQVCELLDAAGVEFGIQEIAGDALAGAPSHQEVWVAAREVERSQSLLREKLGYFPLPEVDATSAPEAFTAGPANDVPGDDADELEVVGQFETAAEAERLRAMLAGEGVVARVAGDEDEPPSFEVRVRRRDHERALALAVRTLGVS